MPADDLAALTGVGPPVATARLHSRHAELADLGWDARRLTSEQLSEVKEFASTLKRP
jgi:hypothetical protein